VAVALTAPAVAAADTSGSDNWSGYAVHANHKTFKQVSGTWGQPTGTCSAGRATYSAYWVGLGGYSQTSNALEQLGTEFDCSAAGVPQLSAWYELVPAPIRKISMTVEPGDQITGNVSIVGRDVTLTLTDTTRNETFSKTIFDHKIDRTSAEWITEAPSSCAGSSHCSTLPLTPFGSVTFTGATAVSRSGHSGSISSPLWDRTKIVLAHTARFVSTHSPAEASPSALTNGGTAFTVSYSSPAPSTPPPTATPPAYGGGGDGGGGYGGGGGCYPGGGWR